jgi:hypothetical protein
MDAADMLHVAEKNRLRRGSVVLGLSGTHGEDAAGM